MRYVIIGLALASAIYILTGYAFAKGYEQGYVEGQERALMSPQSLQTCTKWWFGDEARAKQAMNQYCQRNKK